MLDLRHLKMRLQMTRDNGLRTQIVFVMFVCTHFYLRALADLKEIIPAAETERCFENSYSVPQVE